MATYQYAYTTAQVLGPAVVALSRSRRGCLGVVAASAITGVLVLGWLGATMLPTLNRPAAAALPL